MTDTIAWLNSPAGESWSRIMHEPIWMLVTLKDDSTPFGDMDIEGVIWYA